MNTIILLTPTQVAAAIGVHYSTLVRWEKAGTAPPSVGAGRTRRYPLDKFEEWQKHRESQKATA